MPLEPTAIQPLIERLAARAFSNLEYTLALVLLNSLLALGWYFVFYPRTTAVLAVLIASGAGGASDLLDAAGVLEPDRARGGGCRS